MKNMYVCEFCGAMYDDYGVAMECERTHVELDIHPNYNNYKELCTYTKGQQLPETIVLGG